MRFIAAARSAAAAAAAVYFLAAVRGMEYRGSVWCVKKMTVVDQNNEKVTVFRRILFFHENPYEIRHEIQQEVWHENFQIQ